MYVKRPGLDSQPGAFCFSALIATQLGDVEVIYKRIVKLRHCSISNG